MPVLSEHVIRPNITSANLNLAVAFAYHVLSHAKSSEILPLDPLHQFVQVLLDELAERMVIEWLISKGKSAEPVMDKGATNPVLWHDIWVTDIRGLKIKASVRTFLSTGQTDIENIIQSQAFVIRADEVRGINFSVGYWLKLQEKPRVKLPSLQQVAIFGWISDKNIRMSGTNESRADGLLKIKISDMRPVEELLEFLV